MLQPGSSYGEHARGAAAYALCYDGYIEIDDGVKDALIAEGGVPGEDTGYAVSYLYEMDEEGNVTFEEEPAMWARRRTS